MKHAKEPKRYIEEPVRTFEKVFLSDEEYSRALDSFVILCADFVPVDRKNKRVYLAKRSVHAGKGLWRFGGRMFAGEAPRTSLTRLAKREIGLTIDPGRFSWLMVTEEIFSWRKQLPEDKGVHDVILLYTIELSEDEIAQAVATLDPNEYDTSFGIKSFNREELVVAKARPVLIDIFDEIFTKDS